MDVVVVFASSMGTECSWNDVRHPPVVPDSDEGVDLSEFMGQSIAIEVFDDDPKGQVFVDDLRFTTQ